MLFLRNRGIAFFLLGHNLNFFLVTTLFFICRCRLYHEEEKESRYQSKRTSLQPKRSPVMENRRAVRGRPKADHCRYRWCGPLGVARGKLDAENFLLYWPRFLSSVRPGHHQDEQWIRRAIKVRGQAAPGEEQWQYRQ